MVTGNTDLDNRLINRQVGQVIAFHGNDLQITKIYIKFHVQKAGLMAMPNGNFAKNNGWVQNERSDSSFRLKIKAGVIYWTKFPVTLSYACIFHKIQAISLENVVIRYNLNKKKSFLAG